MHMFTCWVHLLDNQVCENNYLFTIFVSYGYLNLNKCYYYLHNHIVSTCMNMELNNSNTHIGYKLAFYRYMYSIDIYRTINFSIKQLSGTNINDEQIEIVNNLSIVLSVRKGNNCINVFTWIEINYLINYLFMMLRL